MWRAESPDAQITKQKGAGGRGGSASLALCINEPTVLYFLVLLFSLSHITRKKKKKKTPLLMWLMLASASVKSGSRGVMSAFSATL